MKATELIEKLQQVVNEYGDLTLCFREWDDYWGFLYNEIDDVYTDFHGQPKGPKSGEIEDCIILK